MARAPARARLREAHSDDPHGLGLATDTHSTAQDFDERLLERLSTSGEAKGERENETNELDWTVTAAWVSESC